MKHLPLHNVLFQELYNEFVCYVKTKGYSRGEKSYYPSCVREFLFFLEDRKVFEISSVTAIDVMAYRVYLSMRPSRCKRGKLSDSMIKCHLFSLRLFFDYLEETEVLECSPMYLSKFVINEYKERNILTTNEIHELYTVCASGQDKAIISLAYGCGLRRSEIEKLDIADVHIQQGVVLVRDGKWHKNRTVPMSNGILSNLKDYIINERMNLFNHAQSPEHSLFINSKGQRLKGSNMNSRLKQLIQSTNNKQMISKEITLHCLRHSIATHLLDNGATIEFVQRFLGHCTIDTALIYAKKRKQRQRILNQIL